MSVLPFNSTLHLLSKDEHKRWSTFRQNLTLLKRRLPAVSAKQDPEPGKWPDFEKYAPQVLSFCVHWLWPEPVEELPVDFAQVLSDLGTFMWHAGLIKDGSTNLQAAEDILDDRQVNADNQLRGDLHANLGIISSFSGVSERPESMERRTRALAIRRKAFERIPPEKVTRVDAIRFHNAKCDRAFVFTLEERFDEAKPIFEECVRKYQSRGNEDDVWFEYAK